MSRDAGFPAAPPFGADLDVVAELRGFLALDVPLAFGFGFGATVHSRTYCET